MIQSYYIRLNIRQTIKVYRMMMSYIKGRGVQVNVLPAMQ